MGAPLVTATRRTLVYADIFDYPLKEEEIWQWLIFDVEDHGLAIQLTRQNFKKSLNQLSCSSIIGLKRGYYFLGRREDLVDIRRNREELSRVRLAKAQKIAGFLKYIPTVKMVAVTGNLAMGNCDWDDDIDLLIIATSGTLWLTRFLSTILLDLMGERRRPLQKEVRNKICLNMFLDERYLKIPPCEQDLFIAHEIVQLKPLFQTENTYRRLLVDNLWIKDYLPNSLETPGLTSRTFGIVKKQSVLLPIFFRPLEKLVEWLQLLYMKRHRTNEVVKHGVIRFHPQDARLWIMKEYQKRLSNLPLDK